MAHLKGANAFICRQVRRGSCPQIQRNTSEERLVIGQMRGYQRRIPLSSHRSQCALHPLRNVRLR